MSGYQCNDQTIINFRYSAFRKCMVYGGFLFVFDEKYALEKNRAVTCIATLIGKLLHSTAIKYTDIHKMTD